VTLVPGTIDGRGVRGLDTDDIRTENFTYGKTVARSVRAAADRSEQHIDVGTVVDDFKACCSDTRD
jgi:hypothetical protein